MNLFDSATSADSPGAAPADVPASRLVDPGWDYAPGATPAAVRPR
ncbi:hypothetical protein AB0G74_06430 [Streptomyces sp. NPDC020875]